MRTVLFTPRSTSSRPPDRRPVWKTIGYTLSISARFLWSALWGRGTRERCDQLLDWFWRKILDSGNCSLVVDGRENFVRGSAHVVMSNHASLLDIPVLMAAVPGSVRMVTKEELTRIPVWGHALIASGFIPIDRRDRAKAIRQLEKAKENLASGINVWIAPEGTRSRTGDMGPFKKGGFHTALALGAPIVPTWIFGAGEVIPPDQFKAHYGRTVEVKFGPPISTVGMTAEDIPALMEQVRAAMVALRDGRSPAAEANPAAAGELASSLARATSAP